MNDAVVNGAQGTEQWRRTNRIRALIGERGEISCRGGWGVMVQLGREPSRWWLLAYESQNYRIFEL